MLRKILPAIFVITNIYCSYAQQAYFQQRVNYKIDVRLNDTLHELFANEQIEYTNNSFEELKEIYMHLWPNAYKDDNTALAKQMLESGETDFHFSKLKDRGYIDQLDFKVNGTAVKLEIDSKHIDICKLILNEPLKPGQKLTITTPFHVKIPVGIFSRLGHIDQAYQITQWYPKPAVYDRDGWHPMPYLNQGEFYSEYGTFDVSITVPENYVVGATGDLVDGQKELEWLDKKVWETEAKEKFDSKDLAHPASSTNFKTLKYHQDSVHDFAWFADKRFHVLKGSVTLPHSKRSVTTWVMFTNAEAHLWKKSIPYVNDAVYYYSLWNGDYPYNVCTAVDGALSAGGGMEYPTITVIGTSGSDAMLETVIVHEVGHNWFYGILGSNERQHPWMDEGINSFNELRYLRTKYPERTLLGQFAGGKGQDFLKIGHLKQSYQYYLTYLVSAKRNIDQPCELPAHEYSELNYGAIVYSKTAVLFDYLKDYLGDETFDKCARAYYDKWKFKHPDPKEIEEVYESVSGKGLNWFFKDLIQTTKEIDYKICRQGRDKTVNTVTIKNSGEVASPVSIYGFDKEGKMRSSVYYDGFEGKKDLSFPPGAFSKYVIDAPLRIPELNKKNNTLKTRGLFKKCEPLEFQLGSTLEKGDKTQIAYFPVIGWNNYNKFMAGIAFYNNLIPQKKFEWLLMPMYATGTNDLNGAASLRYNFFPDFAERISISADVKHYAFNVFESSNSNAALKFTRVSPMLEYIVKNNDMRSPFRKYITLRSVMVDHTLYGDRNVYTPLILIDSRYRVNELAAGLSINKTLYPGKGSLALQQSGSFSKLNFEWRQSIIYNAKQKAIDIRLFAGSFLQSPKGFHGSRFRYRLSGQQGYEDYMYDEIFLDRSSSYGSGVLSHQFLDRDANLKAFYPVSTDKWITAINIKAQLPVKYLPAVFADFAYYNQARGPFLTTKYQYDAGLAFGTNGVFEIYLPLLVSKDIQEFYKAGNTKFAERIRFILNLSKLNPFDKVRNFSI